MACLYLGAPSLRKKGNHIVNKDATFLKFLEALKQSPTRKVLINIKMEDPSKCAKTIKHLSLTTLIWTPETMKSKSITMNQMKQRLMMTMNYQPLGLILRPPIKSASVIRIEAQGPVTLSWWSVLTQNSFACQRINSHITITEAESLTLSAS